MEGYLLEQGQLINGYRTKENDMLDPITLNKPLKKMILQISIP